MSRIGKKPIPVPDGVTIEIRPGSVAVRGPKGDLEERVSPAMTALARLACGDCTHARFPTFLRTTSSW